MTPAYVGGARLIPRLHEDQEVQTLCLKASRAFIETTLTKKLTVEEHLNEANKLARHLSHTSRSSAGRNLLMGRAYQHLLLAEEGKGGASARISACKITLLKAWTSGTHK